MTNPNDPIAPIPGVRTDLSDAYKGLTRREYFAVMAMQGMLTDLYSSIMGNKLMSKLEQKPEESTCQTIARNAVSFANALIAELNKEANP